jgi:nucleotide-binding universal stress UspA family protein
VTFDGPARATAITLTGLSYRPGPGRLNRPLAPMVGVSVLKNLVVAVDGSPSADKALSTAIELGKALSATLTIISVAPLQALPMASGSAIGLPAIHEAAVKVTKDLLSRLQEQVARAGLKVSTVLLDGYVVEELLHYLDEHSYDLLVMGARGLSTGKRLLLGSVSDAVVHHTKIPVLIIRA